MVGADVSSELVAMSHPIVPIADGLSSGVAILTAGLSISN